jgi:hypothetical protein
VETGLLDRTENQQDKEINVDVLSVEPIAALYKMNKNTPQHQLQYKL